MNNLRTHILWLGYLVFATSHLITHAILDDIKIVFFDNNDQMMTEKSSPLLVEEFMFDPRPHWCDYKSVVIEHNETPVAVAVYEDILVQQARDLGYITVDSNYRTKKLGARLLSVLEDDAKSKKIPKITLKSVPESLQFYIKQGFSAVDPSKPLVLSKSIGV